MLRRVPVGAFLGLLLVGLLVAACGKATAASGASHVLPVQVTLSDYHIIASTTTFQAGQAYHFVITNKGQTSHEFMIMPTDEGAMTGMSMAAMDHMAVAAVSDFPPGQTRVLDYTFPRTMAGTHPQFACYDPGHYESGMYLDVTVRS